MSSIPLSAVAGIVGALTPLLALVARLVFSSNDPKEVRSIRRHLDLLEKLPDSASGPLEKLIQEEVTGYVESRKKRSRRRVNGANLATIIVVLVVAGLLSWGIGALAAHVPLLWILVGVVILVAVVLVAAGGIPNFFTYEEPSGGGRIRG